MHAAQSVARACRLHGLTERDVPTALGLYRDHPRLSARDAFFAAVAVNRGIGAILSPDRDFDGLTALQRIDPADDAAVATLAGSTGA